MNFLMARVLKKNGVNFGTQQFVGFNNFDKKQDNMHGAPNPASNVLRITSSGFVTKENIHLKLYQLHLFFSLTKI